MRKKLTVRKVGTSIGVTLPRELGLSEGDEVYAVRTAEGVHLTRYDPDFQQAMEAADEFLRRYPNAMKKLAGS